MNLKIFEKYIQKFRYIPIEKNCKSNYLSKEPVLSSYGIWYSEIPIVQEIRMFLTIA